MGRSLVAHVLPKAARPQYAGLRSIPHSVERSQRDFPVRVGIPCVCSHRTKLAIESLKRVLFLDVATEHLADHRRLGLDDLVTSVGLLALAALLVLRRTTA